jgi:hypothetical protein
MPALHSLGSEGHAKNEVLKAVLHGKMTNAPRPETLANFILEFHCYLCR